MADLTPPRKAPTTTPPLQQGDVLARGEFERRYATMPRLKKAELIDGIVHLGTSVRADTHGIPHATLAALLGVYATKHPGLIVADNATVRLDTLNEPQPDLLLMREGGQARVDEEGYITGAPEFIAEIAASSAAYDLHSKKRAYLRAGVREYLVWLADENRLLWWQLQQDDYIEIAPAADGTLTSPNFPGLVIDVAALTQGDLATALARLA
jgi:Uma2 family endonuclease